MGGLLCCVLQPANLNHFPKSNLKEEIPSWNLDFLSGKDVETRRSMGMILI